MQAELANRMRWEQPALVPRAQANRSGKAGKRMQTKQASRQLKAGTISLEWQVEMEVDSTSSRTEKANLDLQKL